MHLYAECEAIVLEAIEQLGTDCENSLREFLHESCDGHEVSIYYHKAITFCSEQDTDDGEDWLEDCGCIVQQGDTFGAIACRIAFATLLCECERILTEKLEELE